MPTDTASTDQATTEPTNDSPDLNYPWQSAPDQTFTDIAGREAVQRRLRHLIIEPLQDRTGHYERFDVPIPTLLLSGPPGTGKTHIVRSLAGETKRPWVRLIPGVLHSTSRNGRAARIDRLRKEAHWLADEYGCALVFLDDLATLLPRPSFDPTPTGASTIDTAWLQFIDQCERRDVLVVGATSRPDLLAAAATRNGRFDRHLRLERPATPTRKALLEHYLSDRPTRIPDRTIVALANHTDDWTAAALERLITEAARIAARQDADTITPGHLEAALSRTDPAVVD